MENSVYGIIYAVTAIFTIAPARRGVEVASAVSCVPEITVPPHIALQELL